MLFPSLSSVGQGRHRLCSWRTSWLWGRWSCYIYRCGGHDWTQWLWATKGPCARSLCLHHRWYLQVCFSSLLGLLVIIPILDMDGALKSSNPKLFTSNPINKLWSSLVWRLTLLFPSIRWVLDCWLWQVHCFCPTSCLLPRLRSLPSAVSTLPCSLQPGGWCPLLGDCQAGEPRNQRILSCISSFLCLHLLRLIWMNNSSSTLVILARVISLQSPLLLVVLSLKKSWRLALQSLHPFTSTSIWTILKLFRSTLLLVFHSLSWWLLLEECQPIGSRYDGQIVVYGKAFQVHPMRFLSKL